VSRALRILGLVTLLFGLGAYQVLGAVTAFSVANAVVGVAACLAAAGLWLAQLGRNAQPALRGPTLRAIGAAAALCLASAAVYALALRADVRLDWTFEGRFELSEATISLLAKLREPLQLTLYYDEGDPRIRNTRVLLEEFERAADVRVDKRSIEDFPDDEDRFGIGSSNSVVAQHDGGWALIERPTEGGLYEGIATLVHTREGVLYVSVGAGEGDMQRSDDLGYSGLRAALETEGYTVRPLPLAISDDVPIDASAVLLIAPRRPIPEASLGALRRFVHQGGGLIVFLEPDVESGLEKLLAGFGLGSSRSWVIDPHSGAIEGEPLGRSPVASAYSEHPVSHGLSGNRMTFFRGTRGFQLRKAAPGDLVKGVVLSSRDAWLDPDAGALGPNDVPVPPAAAHFDYQPIVAAAEIRRDGQRARLLAFGDADVASNRYLRALYNLDLVLNGVHWVTERESQIALRPKSGGRQLIQFPVPLQRSLQALYGAGLLVPELLLLAAAAVWLRQRAG